MRVTRADVAARAGVSGATVSYVMNGSREISQETKNRVLEAIKELNYKPDMIARSMSTNQSKQLGLVLNDITNPIYGEVILGFENAAMEKGFFVNICTGHQNLDEYFDNFLARRIDGIFIAALPYKFHVEKIYRLVDSGIKVVTSGNMDIDLKKVSSIESDANDAMDQIFQYLTDLGHVNIAYLSGLGKNQSFDNKTSAYLNAVSKFNLRIEDSLLAYALAPFTTTIQDGYELTQRFIDLKRPFTALICTNDLMAIGAIMALKEKKISVPNDISVVGFDDINLSSIWDPSLTTMALPKIELGRKAFQLLYSNMKNGNTGYHLNKLSLKIRNSTGPRKN